jgi:hypothetical protein
MSKLVDKAIAYAVITFAVVGVGLSFLWALITTDD